MTKSCGKRKRAENNGNGCEPKAAKNDIKCEELRASKHEGAKINREEVQPESHEQSSGGDTVKRSSWASELTNANCLGKLRKLTQLSVVMRSKHLSEVLAKVTELVPTSKETEQIPILKYVLLWANLSAGTPADVTVYDWFSEKMTAVIDQGPRTEVAAGLRRLNDSLLALLRDQKECRDCQRTTISENRLRLDLLVWRVNAMAASERNNHFRQVVDAFKHAMCGDPDKKATRFLNKTLKTSYADSVGDFIVKSELDSEMKKFKIKASTTCSESIQAQADKLLETVKQLKGRDTKRADECILQFVEVTQHCERNWQPRANACVSECHDRLVEYSETFMKGDARRQRIIVLERCQ
ncbi:hypothetical protein PInf_007855 [Phytophthora infestans]|nr:hypothetical protein PInf_007855 [Phytophthora infestans]